MDLAQHAAVLWRFRTVVAGGIVLGIVLAVLAAYQVPSMTPRGAETWTSESSLLVTQAGFPEGRVTLPEGQTSRSDKLAFADPNRLSALASLYAQLATGDRVRARLPERPKPSQIQALPVEGNAATQLPVIKLTTTAGSGPAARALNRHTVQALSSVLASEQAKNAIPDSQRIRISEISAPAAPIMTKGRSHTASILALLLCVLGAVALAHLLAAIRDVRVEDESLDGVVVPWAVADGHVADGAPDTAAAAHDPAQPGWLSGGRRGP